MHREIMQALRHEIKSGEAKIQKHRLFLIFPFPMERHILSKVSYTFLKLSLCECFRKYRASFVNKQ